MGRVLLAWPAVFLLAGPGVAADLFSDRAVEWGVDFTHFNGRSGEYYFSEIVGAGAALFDYDGDGDLDLFLLQGHLLGAELGKTMADALDTPRGQLADRLFRNDLTIDAEGRRQVRFVDVTASSGLRSTGYGMGVAAADFDNDGWVDLFVTNFGANQLWKNRGDGTFVDHTAGAGLGDIRWSIPAVSLDFDRDGWLDLYVGNYVDFSLKNHKLCRTIAGAADYCGPLSFPPLADRLYRNLGDGTFEDVSTKSRIGREFGGALGVVAADLDGDGWQDIYVANDGVPNQMWINQHDGSFRNEALLAGTAVSAMGRPEASMGVVVADYDGDGDEDIFMTHLLRETNTLYRNEGQGTFVDATDEAGLGSPSWPYTSFGTVFFDYDNDGALDLLVASGSVRVLNELEAAGDPFPFHQKNQLFHNRGNGRFVDVTAIAGAVFQHSEVSRGLAWGDIDNDGDADVVLTNNGGRTRLLINNVGQQSHWLGLRLVAGKPQRDQQGARLALRRKGRSTLWRRVDSGGGFAVANDPRILIGLGDSPQVDGLEVIWPDGWRENFSAEADRYTTLVRGRGKPAVSR